MTAPGGTRYEQREIEVIGTLGSWRARAGTVELPRFVDRAIEPVRIPYHEQSRRERLAWRRFGVAAACLFGVFLAGALLERGTERSADRPAAVEPRP